MKNSLFLLSAFFVLELSAQTDSLNRYNSKGKKHGTWKVYLDTLMLEVDSTDAYFYGYEKFDNGECVTMLTRRGEGWRKRCRIEYSDVLPEKGKPVLLNGTFKYYEDNSQLACLEIYKDGKPHFMEAYSYGKNDSLHPSFIESLYFDKLYNNIPGTYYILYTSHFSDGTTATTEYWYRKGNKGWKSYKIK